MPAPIRLRDPADIDACTRLLEIVHKRDHYPLLWPDDASRWLSPRELIAAWVAERNRSILGHVALRYVQGDGAGLEWADSLGLAPRQMAWVSRLFVDPEARRRGLGSDLLNTALEHATHMGLRPALEVAESDRAAIELYERSGLVRAQSRDWTLPGGAKTLLHSYVAPTKGSETT